MSDNKLLAENTIRRFMKLANVEAMTDNFISENYEEEINEEEEAELEENIEDLEEQEEPEEEAEEEPMELDAEMGELEDEGPEADMDEPGAADMSLTEEEARLLIDLGERLAAAMDEGAEEGEEPELDDAPEMDDELGGMEGEEEPPGYGGGREASPMMEEEFDQEDLVNEVLKRVTKRLVAAKLQNRK